MATLVLARFRLQVRKVEVPVLDEEMLSLFSAGLLELGRQGK